MPSAPPPWAPPPNVTVERLAFLAARDHLARVANPWWLKVASVFERGSANTGTPGMAGLEATVHYRSPRVHGMRAAGMAELVIACDQAASDLTEDDRAALRATGALPDWFLERVVKDAKDNARRRRG